MKTLARDTDKAEIVRRLRTLRPDSTRRWGRMSVHQMVCHLADALRMASGEKPTKLNTGLLQRTAVKWAALHMPFPWPPGIPSSPEIASEFGGTQPVEFAADLAQVEALLEQMTSTPPGVVRPPHPLFGPLSETEWLRWGYRHLDHHLRQFGA
jgi:Protein of unknown function (DUF1569)